jgi:hypothetical protein
MPVLKLPYELPCHSSRLHTGPVDSWSSRSANHLAIHRAASAAGGVSVPTSWT